MTRSLDLVPLPVGRELPHRRRGGTCRWRASAPMQATVAGKGGLRGPKTTRPPRTGHAFRPRDTSRRGSRIMPALPRRSVDRSRKDPSVKRFALILLTLAGLVLAASAVPLSATSNATQASLRGKAAGPAGYDEPLCVSRSSLCIDAYDNPGDEYVGHDEPSIEYKSSVPGSGNDMTYTVTLPKDPTARPSPAAPAPTWNFQLRPTFWFGLTLCDTQSAPEFTQVVHRQHRREQPGRHKSRRAGLHRQASRATPSWNSSSTARATFLNSRASAAPPPRTARR